jgi:hypothetical protein
LRFKQRRVRGLELGYKSLDLLHPREEDDLYLRRSCDFCCVDAERRVGR